MAESGGAGKRAGDEDTEPAPSGGATDSDELLREIAAVPARAPPPRQAAPPERLGRFRITERIGAGGMGVVYRAEDETLRRSVALKVLPAAFEADAERRRRFLREARAASAVSHPNLAAVYEVGEADGTVFIAMELVAGETLRERLARGRVGVAEALRIARDVARGVGAAHARGIVHRDLKPENVMLASDGTVKVLDFGLAKLPQSGSVAGSASTVTVEGRIVGTPGYMSPEQAEGTTVDARTDVFALGVLLYEMTTGTRPFRGDSAMKVLVATTRDEPTPPSRLEPSVSPELDRIVVRCLAKDPEARLADAGALLEALEAAGGRSSRRVGWRVPAVAVSVVAIVGAGLLVRRASPGSPAAASSSASIAWPGPGAGAGPLLVAPSSTLGCSVFEATGVTPPAGWLGAAASSLACRRMQWMLGGDSARVIPAAALLDFPAGYVSDAPDDPYAPPELRPRSLSAAAARASATLDGTVTADGSGFTVELRLLAPDGREAGRGAATAPELDQAVEAASNALGATGAFPVAKRTTPEVERAFAFVHPEAGWNVDRISFAASAAEGVALCAQVVGHDDQALWERRIAEATCGGGLKKPPPPPAPLDHGSAGTLWASVAVEQFWDHALPDANAVRAELEATAARETNADAKASLLIAAANIVSHEAPSTAFAMYTEVARTLPWTAAWQNIYVQPAFMAPSVEARHAVRKAGHAWAPEESGLAQSDSEDVTDPEASLRWVRRAHELSPVSDAQAIGLGRRLLIFDRFAETRALAARFLTGPPQNRATGTYLLVNADASEGFPGRAIALALDFLAQSPLSTGETPGSTMIPGRAALIATVIGDEARVADAWATRFALADPPRLSAIEYEDSAPQLMMTCLLASRPNRAPCVEAIARMYGRFDQPLNQAFLEGARRAAAGDYKAAVRAFRPLVQNQRWMAWLPVDVFDAAGEPELADTIDALAVSTKVARRVKGHGFEEVRIARRAWKRGDKVKARALAKELVASWSGLDVEVPVLAELRRMAAE